MFLPERGFFVDGDSEGLTSRWCRECGGLFDGVMGVAWLDQHCGSPTLPCPTFHGEQLERKRAFRQWYRWKHGLDLASAVA